MKNRKACFLITVQLLLGLNATSQAAPYIDLADGISENRELERKYEGPIEKRTLKIAGWSAYGYIAYFVEVETGESGAGYFENFYIQDLVSDAIIFRTNYSINDWVNDASTSIFSNASDYLKCIRKYEINDAEKNELQSFPTTIEGMQFSVGITIEKVGVGYYSDDRIIEYTVFAFSGKKQKIIGHFSVNPCMGIEIIGFLKSPFESRIAVIIGEIRHGWEGPPHYVEYRIIGCDLERGF